MFHRSSSPLRLAALAALVALLCALVTAQEELQLDDAGNTIAVSIVTDAAGDPLQTLVLSTLATDAAAAAETDTATDPAVTVTTALTTASTTATTAAVTTDPLQNVGAPAQVLTPASRCTTAGCPVLPTTYTQDGLIVTWFATTPATPVPQVTSSGAVLDVASYITSVSSATGRGASGATALSGASSRGVPLGAAADWALMAGVALVGALVGTVAVL